jgi:hypothetical protein
VDSRRVRTRLLVKAARTSKVTLARNRAVNMVVTIGEDAGATNQRNAATVPNTDAATSDKTTARNVSALDGERLRDSIRDA